MIPQIWIKVGLSVTQHKVGGSSQRCQKSAFNTHVFAIGPNPSAVLIRIRQLISWLPFMSKPVAYLSTTFSWEISSVEVVREISRSRKPRLLGSHLDPLHSSVFHTATTPPCSIATQVDRIVTLVFVWDQRPAAGSSLPVWNTCDRTARTYRPRRLQ